MLKVALFVYPHFNPLLLAIPQTVFGTSLLDEPLFDFQTVSIDGKTVAGECGCSITPQGGLDDLADADMVIISGWHDVHAAPDARLLRALKKAHARGATLVGLCFGAYLLAYAGLLDHRRATTHWLANEDFRQRFPLVRLDCNVLYVEEERLITSAGTSAGLDCCLFIIRKFYGVRTANKVARLMVAAPHREGGQAQFIEQATPVMTTHSGIRQLLDTMRQNPAQNRSIDDLAKQLCMSRRTFTRHFQRATGLSYRQWLIRERLQYSLALLESSALGIDKIAETAGFASTTAFRQHFKQRYRTTPAAWRKTFADSPAKCACSD